MTCTLTVQFQITSADFATFLAAVRENAALSVKNEPGCLRFDVLVPMGDAPSVLLYEIYRSRADFDLHLKTDHYLHFDAATQGMVEDKTVVFHHLTEHAKP
jgi:(4S)-4-hydroxy-5-phosphonooxypentane-2,3-dione isomerase